MVDGFETVIDDLGPVQIVAEEDVAECEVDGLAIAAPRRELATHVAQLPDGNAAAAHDVDVRYRPADLGQRQGKDVGLHLSQDSVALGRDHDQARRQGRRSAFEQVRQLEIGGLDRRNPAGQEGELPFGFEGAPAGHGSERRWPGDPNDLLDIGPVPSERDQTFPETRGVDPVRPALDEVGDVTAGGRRDQLDIAASRRNPNEISPDDTATVSGGFDQISAGLARRDNPGPVGRPGRVAVERRRLGQLDRCDSPTVDRCLHEVTCRRVAPGDVDDRLAVGRPDRLILTDIRGRYPTGRAVRQIHHIDPVHRHEGQPLTVR